MEKTESSKPSEILSQEFFDTIKNSKKINIKTQKIKELSKYFSSNKDNLYSSEIKNKIPDLYELLLINLNENNNNYVLAQMELIQVLGKSLHKEENYKLFIKQSLPKLFDKFYLSNTKINEILIKMFSEFIEYKILTIKDYYQYIENIPLDEEDNYRINILNFLYDNINKDKTVLLNNIPKSINELIKKLINDNESDISETASKILNILINRDIESNKKKELINTEQLNDKKNQEDKGGTSMSSFVKNIVSAIKQNVDSNNNNNINQDNKDNNIDGNNENKDNNVNQDLIMENVNINKNDNNNNDNHDNNNSNNNKNNNDKEINNIENKEDKVNAIKKDENINLNNDKDENINNIINKEEKNSDNKNEENKKEEIIDYNKKEENKDEINNKENEKLPEIKNENNMDKIKEKEKKEDIIIEAKKEEKINENITNETNVENIKTDLGEKKSEMKLISEDKKNESNIEIKKEENISDKKEEIPTNEIKEKLEDKNIDIKEDKKPEEAKTEEKKEDLNDLNIKPEENKEIKEIPNKEYKKEEKIDEQKDQIKNEISNKEEKIQEEKSKETIVIKEEKKEDNNNKIIPEIKTEDNIIKSSENKNDNTISNDDKKEETSEKIITENKDIINKENKIEEKKENNNPEINKEEPKKEETKEIINSINTEENKQSVDKKEIIEEKPKEENKLEIKIGENKEIKINDKKEEIKEITDKIENELKKENVQEKKDEKKSENKNDKKKPSGVKSKISKFRKNFGKNKNKDGGFEFELVVDKKKENPPKEKEAIKEEKVNIEEKKEEAEQKINEEKSKSKEIKEAKIEQEKKEEKKEELKPKEPELNQIKEEKPKEKEKIEDKKTEEKTKEKQKEETKEETKEESKPKPISESTTELNPKKEEKIEEETKPQEKTKEEEAKKDSPKETIDNNTNKENTNEEKPEAKSLGINQESLNEFEKKLQLALEQEAKDKNNNENLVDMNRAPIKQKKEDPKFDEIKSILGKEIIESLFSPKWETKKHGFELINEFINTKSKQDYNINDLIEYMKLKLKNYKETNFNINREAINIYINMIKKKIIPKDSLINIILAYHEKLSDIKLKENIIELINNSFDIIEPSNILKQIITKISKKNNAKLLIEYSTFFGNVVEEYEVKDLPNKDIIDFCKILANNSNPQVRTSAISLLCILYKYLGKDVKTLTRDIKESTLKLIDAELDKVKVIDPKESTNKKKKVASVIENSDNKPGNNNNKNNDLIPPQDISKKITPQIIKLLNSAKWAEKKEGCENIEKILTSANMRILPNGLNTLMTTIKKKLSDSNKNFVKMLVSLLSKLIEAMKQGFKQWAKPIALGLIPNLADKNQLMRNECQNCFDKWVEFAGFDSLVIHFPKFLTTDNVEMRIEILNFFMKYKDKFNKSIGENVYKDMMNPLLICLQDRSSNVRNLSEEIIKISLVYNPIVNYYKKIEDFKPAIAKTLKQILDKIKKETSSNEENNNNNTHNNNINIESDNQSQSLHLATEPNKTNEKLLKVNNNNNSSVKTSNKKLTIQTSEASLKSDDSEKNESSTTEDALSNYNTINTISNFSSKVKKAEKDSNNKTNKKAGSNLNSKKTKPKRKLSEDDLVNPLGTAMNKQMPASTVDHLASNSTILRKKEFKSFQKHPSQVVKPNNSVFLINVKVIPNKTKRYEKDKKTKFNLETSNKDYFMKLKEQCKSLFTEIFSKKIFSDDFRKQVEAFKDMKSQIEKKINIPIYLDNLDLILKIIGIKILNSLNPTLMKNFFEFLDSLYQVILENKYKLNDTEANIIISLLIDKLSLNNNTLKEHLLSLLNKYIEYMDTNKIMSTVINIALNKNNKIKTDILELTIDLVSQEKLNISNKVYAKLFCRFLPIYDNIIKAKTLSLFQEIYSNIGEELWNMIEISEKDKEFLEENLCDEDNEDEEREGEEEEDDEEGKDDNNNQISNEVENNNEINSNTNEKNISNIEENKKGNKNTEKMKILGGKNGPLTKDDLDIILDNLLIDDQNEKLNTIIILHENICGKYDQNKEILIPNIDKIITTFKVVSHKIFYMKDLKSIPIKLAKYLAIVFCKLASNKELISHLSYDILLDICRELMRYLLIKDLDHIGEQQEGNIIFKSINSTMLRILENCDTTFVISAFLELIKEFLDKDDKNMVNLAIKCLLKSTHNLEQNINSINISKILLQIHLLLLSLQKHNKDIKKSQTNALIMDTVKNIVGYFVKLKKEKILEEYSKSVKNHQFNDKYLLKWIKAALEKP